MHHVVDGPADAPALILSNSLGSTLEMWDPQLAALTGRFRVVLYDLRGHGRSPVPGGPYDIAALGDDVLGLMDRLGIARAHLCGLSLGGLVSMRVATAAPERVDRLVLCCTTAWFGPPEPWFERAALVRADGTGAVADTVVGRWFTPAFAAEHAALVTRMRDMIASTPAEGYAACCEVVGSTDLRPALGAIDAPTLIVAGDQDPAVPRDKIDALSAGIPGAHVETVPAAHLANVERSERVTDLIVEHLLSTGSEGPR